MNKLISILGAITVVSIFSDYEYHVLTLAVLRPFDVLFGILLFLVTCYALVSSRPIGLMPGKQALFTMVVLFSVYVSLNGFFLGSLGMAVKETVQNLEFIILLLIITMIASRRDSRDLFVAIFFAGCCAWAIYTALFHIVQGQFSNYKILDSSKATFGLFALSGLCIYLRSRGEVKTWVHLSILGSSVLLLMLSGERKAWVAFAVAVLAVFLAEQKLKKAEGKRVQMMVRVFYRVALAVPVLLVGMYWAAGSDQYVSRQASTFVEILDRVSLDEGIDYESKSGASDRTRLYLLHFALNSVKQHPVFGIGTGRWHERIRWIAPTEGGRAGGSHNEYQRIAVENGMVGLFLYLCVHFFMFRLGFQLLRESPSRYSLTLLLVFGLVFYGASINFFLGGGALNKVFLVLPVGLVLGYARELRSLKEEWFAQLQLQGV